MLPAGQQQLILPIPQEKRCWLYKLPLTHNYYMHAKAVPKFQPHGKVPPRPQADTHELYVETKLLLG